MLERQTEYAKTFVDFSLEPSTLDKESQVNLLVNTIDKFIEFFYSQNISKDLIIFLFNAQQKENFIQKSPTFLYLRKLIGAIFDKSENDREIIFKTVFILSQINSPRIMRGFSLSLLGQEDFIQ